MNPITNSVLVMFVLVMVYLTLFIVVHACAKNAERTRNREENSTTIVHVIPIEPLPPYEHPPRYKREATPPGVTLPQV